MPKNIYNASGKGITLNQFIYLLNSVRIEHDKATVQPASKVIICENMVWPEISLKYSSIGLERLKECYA